MGLDEALLLGAAVPATLRLYRWQPAGLSLGYFQASTEFAEVAGDHVLVRRLTGGGAIYHEDEITFALTLDAALLPMAVPDSYELIHAAVHDALLEVGIATSHPARAPISAARPAQPWCFADPVAQDLLSHTGHKIVGSAQRRIRRPTARVLHHGSIPLRAPSVTPFCGSVADYDDPARVEASLEEALIRQLGIALRARTEPGTPTADELGLATELARGRYSDPGFTHRR
jgi:lipoate-protein ligase A